MHWEIDERTAQAATAHPLLIGWGTPASQPSGHAFSVEKWNHRVVQPAAWPTGALRSDPDQIIKQFQDEHYTQGLAMVVSWGEMWRQPSAIWGKRDLGSIEQTLHDCAQSILGSESIADSWRSLTGLEDGQLGWSAVITSKTLQFLCRSLGFEQDPPVAIDGAVIRQRVWPVFRDSISPVERPGNWEGNTFAAYSRYMTAVLTWAGLKQWKTTEMEATIFKQFG